MHYKLQLYHHELFFMRTITQYPPPKKKIHVSLTNYKRLTEILLLKCIKVALVIE